MSAQDRIARLCQEALESEPSARAHAPASVAEALAKFNRCSLPAETEAPARQFAPAPVPVAAAETQAPAAVVEKPAAHTEDPELASLIEEREQKLARSRARFRMTANCLIIGICLGTIGAFTLSPTLRGKVDTLVHHLQGGVEDVKMMGNGVGSYDEALAGVAQRGLQIDEATAALGIDPASVSEDEDPHMQAELDAMMAGGGPTTSERNAKLQGAGKIVTALTGRTAPEVDRESAGQ